MKPSLAEIPIVILAGGKATRLGSHATHTPKYLQKISETLTFADLHLRRLREWGFRNFVFSLSHLGEQVREHLERKKDENSTFSFVFDQGENQGTGAAVSDVARALDCEHFFVTYGDTLLSLDAQALFNQHLSTRAKATMSVLPISVCPEQHKANVVLENGLAGYNKKNPDLRAQHIDYGLLALKKEFVMTFPHQRPLDLSAALLPLSQAGKLHAFEAQEPFEEIGSPQALEDFRRRHA